MESSTHQKWPSTLSILAHSMESPQILVVDQWALLDTASSLLRKWVTSERIGHFWGDWTVLMRELCIWRKAECFLDTVLPSAHGGHVYTLWNNYPMHVGRFKRRSQGPVSTQHHHVLAKNVNYQCTILLSLAETERQREGTQLGTMYTTLANNSEDTHGWIVHTHVHSSICV